MGEWILQYWIEAIFGLVAVGLSAGYKRMNHRIKESSRKQEATNGGVQALLRDRIIQVYNHYYSKGFCPIYAMENVEALYKQYQALGGNGTVMELVEKLRKLPTERV